MLGLMVRSRNRSSASEGAEGVANCDHLDLLIPSQLEDEVPREAVSVALDLPVQAFRRDCVESGEISIDHHLLAADEKDRLLERLDVTQRDALAHQFSFPPVHSTDPVL